MNNFIDWSDTDAAARHLAGNWRRFTCFAWHRGYDLEDADRWAIVYTSGRDNGLLDQSNHDEIAKRLSPFMEGDDPDVVPERHSHWAVGYLDGFSIRAFGSEGQITDTFKEFCAIKERLEQYPVLNDEDYSRREYEATLENYRSEAWGLKADLPEGWEAEVYHWFSHNSHNRFIENRDDQGGYAPRDKIIEALTDLGLLPAHLVTD